MRINPIARTTTNYYAESTAVSKKNVTMPSQNTGKVMDLNLLNRNYNQINFKAVPNALATDLVKKIPLEERIASILQNFKLGDLLIWCKYLQDCAKKMYRSENLGNNPIKRSFYIAEEALGGNLGFTINSLGDREVVNLNDFDVPLISGTKTYNLKPEESFYIVDGDIISVQGNLLTMKSKPKTDLSMYRKVFARPFDHEKEVKQQVEQINKKTLSTMFTTKKNAGSKVTFADVGGLDGLKEALKRDIIYPLRYPDAYEHFDVNHGAILYGPPGTGKTHIARALANEAGANFISLNGLDIDSMWAGEAEKNWRNLFQEAKENQPTIIFLDEFDAVAKKRGGIDEHGDKIVNQILTLMTDIDNGKDEVYVLAATNNFENLDKAIVRSGRFGKHYKVDTPDFNGLKDIFKIHTKNKKVDENVDIDSMLRKMESMNATGADVRFVVNEAHNYGYLRAGIFEKMDNKTFKKSDMDDFKILQEDFDKAMEDFTKDRNSSSRRPIGYNR